MVGVEVEGEGVGLGERVAAGELPDDPAGLAVVEPRADVERVVVEEEAQLGGLGGGLPLVGVALQEAAATGAACHAGSSRRPSRAIGAPARERGRAGSAPRDAGPARLDERDAHRGHA